MTPKPPRLTKSGKRVGRPPKQLDADQIEKLAALMCTHEEIATVMDCSTDTLTRRYADNIRKGREQGKASIRRAQYRVGVTNLDRGMLIWLGKQYLGQREPQQIEIVSESADAQARGILAILSQMEQKMPGATKAKDG